MYEEWTLDQTLGWVLWRDPAIVEGLKWGHFGAEVMYNHKPRHAEQEDLLEALRMRDLTCRGSKFGVEDKEEISSIAWKDLRIVPHLTQPCKATQKAEGKSFWVGIIFSASEVKKVFPANGSMKKKKTKGRKKGDGLILGDDERIAYMGKLLDAKEAKSINDAANKAVQKFGVSGSSDEADVKRLNRKYRK